MCKMKIPTTLWSDQKNKYIIPYLVDIFIILVQMCEYFQKYLISKMTIDFESLGDFPK